MAEKKTKKTLTGTKKSSAAPKKTKTSTKKATMKEQIEKLDQALAENEGVDITAFLPEEVVADIETNKQPQPAPENLNLDKEVKKILEEAEPSAEVQELVDDFTSSAAKVEEVLNKEPEKAEEVIAAEAKHVEDTLNKIEELKERVFKMTKAKHRENTFTNLWNGMGYDF